MKKSKVDKKDIERAKAFISNIRLKSKKRERKYISEDIKKRPAQELIDNKGETKRKLYSTGSKVESTSNVILEKARQKLGQLAKQKIVSKKILKKSKTSYTMPNRPVSNVFEDENKFFKGAMKNGML